MKRVQSARQQVNAMKRIIRKDANTIETILDDDGKMCALGGLAHYGAGVSLRTLKWWNAECRVNAMAFAAACDAFPLLTKRNLTAASIYDINDRYPTSLAERRQALCRFLDSLLED